jgi:hypothetical protein
VTQPQIAKGGFTDVIARSEATKQSGVSNEKNQIASLPMVARNDRFEISHQL